MSDPYVNDVELLCNWNGDDGDTTYVSEIGESPVFLGAAEIDTDISLFTGSGTLLLSGSSSNADRNTFGSLGDWNWMHNGTESFTIEVLAYCDDPPYAGAPNSVWDTYRVQTDAGIEFQITGSGASGLKVESKMNGDWGSSAGYFPQATWVLIAFKYDHTINKFWVTKRLAGGSYSESSKTTRTARTLDCDEGRVGYRRATGQYYDGNIEGIRITRGVLRDTDYWPTEPWDGSQPAGVYLQAPFIFSAKSLNVYCDFTGQISGPEYGDGKSIDLLYGYSLELVGNPAIVLPLSSWQATAQIGGDQFMQAVVPAVDDYVAEIAASQGVSDFAIYRAVRLDDGYIHRVKVAQVPLDSASFARGRINYSCTLIGRLPDMEPPTNVTAHKLENIRSVEESAAGLLRVRCSIPWLARPGDLVYIGEPIQDPPGSNTYIYEKSFTVAYMNYYANANDEYADIGER